MSEDGDDRIAHECSESAADEVILNPGDACPFCDVRVGEAATDGGVDRAADGDSHDDADVYPWLALIGAAVAVAILFTAVVGGVL